MNILKLKVLDKNSNTNLKVLDVDHNFYNLAFNMIIRKDQMIHYPEIFEYFYAEKTKLADLPALISKFNLYIDKEDILRVKGKFTKVKDTKFKNFEFPIFLDSKSLLISLLIWDTHVSLLHVGYYQVLNELRKKIWFVRMFSTVKKVVKKCVRCKRFNARPIKLNQSPYREIRLDPSNTPFQNIYLDYMGPFMIKAHGNKTKVWVLVVTCMWSRALNLKICDNLSTGEFLRCFELHCFEHGVPSICFSDLGTQITAGANIIKTFLNDYTCQEYLKQKGISNFNFEHYYKGHSELGSLVEVCVKFTKRLINSSMGRNVLLFREFETLVAKTVHLSNRRPVAFKNSLSQPLSDEVPVPITPEILIHGRELLSLNIVPHSDQSDPDWVPNNLNSIKKYSSKLNKVLCKLTEFYNEQFLVKLMHQSVDIKDRYRPVKHDLLKQGDIVILQEDLTKIQNYPLGVVKDIVVNSQGEITGATIMKGSNREIVKRHSNTIIPLLTVSTDNEISNNVDPSAI